MIPPANPARAYWAGEFRQTLLVRRAAIAKRELKQADLVAFEASRRALASLRAAEKARDELHEYLDVAIDQTVDQPVDVTVMVADMLGFRVLPCTELSEADRALAAEAERDDTGGGACA